MYVGGLLRGVSGSEGFRCLGTEANYQQGVSTIDRLYIVMTWYLQASPRDEGPADARRWTSYGRMDLNFRHRRHRDTLATPIPEVPWEKRSWPNHQYSFPLIKRYVGSTRLQLGGQVGALQCHCYHDSPRDIRGCELGRPRYHKTYQSNCTSVLPARMRVHKSVCLTYEPVGSFILRKNHLSHQP